MSTESVTAIFDLVDAALDLRNPPPAFREAVQRYLTTRQHPLRDRGRDLLSVRVLP